MSKTWKQEAIKWWHDTHPTATEEDEDTDPRSYNVIQRNDQERDSLRLEDRTSEPGWVDLPLLRDE